MPKHMKKLPSPKVIRKSCVAKSTAKKPSMYPKAPEEEYANLSPNSQARIRAEGQKVQNYLVEEAKRAEAVAVLRADQQWAAFSFRNKSCLRRNYRTGVNTLHGC